MSKKSLKELRAARQEKALAARNLYDKTPENGWSDEIKTEFDNLTAEITALDEDIIKAQELLDIEAGGLLADPEDTGLNPDDARASRASLATQEGALFNAWLRGGERALNSADLVAVQERVNSIRADLGVGVPAEGGYLVPAAFSDVLLQALAAYGGMREAGTVMRTSYGTTIPYPTVDETAEEGELLAEHGTATDQDPAFGTKNLATYMFSSKAVPVSFQLLQDSAFDMESLLTSLLTTRLARVTNRMFTTGTGTGQPMGLMTASALGDTSALNTAITYAEIQSLEHSVDPAYRATGRFMFNDSTLLAIKQLADSQNRPLWQPDLANGAPGLIDGYPYTINQDVADIGASARCMAFGAIDRYIVRDVTDVMLFRMDDSAYVKNAQIGFLAFLRSGGNLMDVGGASVKHLANPA